MNTSVSVAIPTYNAADFLKVAIESVLSQTVLPLEIIVVDDGSTDHTRDACAGFGDKVRYIHQENDGTLGAGARAVAIAAAKGEWVALLDHDDRWLPEKLEKQFAAIVEFPDVMAVFTRFETIDQHGKRNSPERETTGDTQYLSSDDAYHYLLTENPFAPSTAIIRTEFIQKHGITEPTESGCADWDLWLGISRHYPVAVIDKVLTQYRNSEGQFCADKHRLAVALEKSLDAQKSKIHPDCDECLKAYRVGQEHVAMVYGVAARTQLDGYHHAMKSGDVTSAFPFLSGALRSSASEVLRPRRLLAVSKNGARGVVRNIMNKGRERVEPS
jgi:hypothetical protein